MKLVFNLIFENLCLNFKILPSLQSFCLYAAFGVFLTFGFAVTFFTACFALDQRRVEEKRHALFFWVKLDDYEVPKCSQMNHSVKVFRWVYSKIIFSNIGKVSFFVKCILLCGICGCNTQITVCNQLQFAESGQI